MRIPLFSQLRCHLFYFNATLLVGIQAEFLPSVSINGQFNGTVTTGEGGPGTIDQLTLANLDNTDFTFCLHYGLKCFIVYIVHAVLWCGHGDMDTNNAAIAVDCGSVIINIQCQHFSVNTNC